LLTLFSTVRETGRERYNLPKISTRAHCSIKKEMYEKSIVRKHCQTRFSLSALREILADFAVNFLPQSPLRAQSLSISKILFRYLFAVGF